jgi:hypothetical protein
MIVDFILIDKLSKKFPEVFASEEYANNLENA